MVLEPRRPPQARSPDPLDASATVTICVLGPFRVLHGASPLRLHCRGKTDLLLSTLAINHARGLARDELVVHLWPDHDPALARQALHSLIHSLHRAFDAPLAGAPPVVYSGGMYRLNAEAGVAVDTARFDALADRGGAAERAGARPRAMAAYAEAVALYRGDLSVGADALALVERERLRARYCGLVRCLAADRRDAGDYAASLAYAYRLLASEPCCEATHRLIMNCLVCRGERAQALRQYRLCEEILRAEFGAEPEAETVALFEQIRGRSQPGRAVGGRWARQG
jgi:DNA-binding SARP family transcriptional activator